MKKLQELAQRALVAVAIAAFSFGLGLGGAYVPSAQAQNYKNSETMWAVGAPGFQLNSSSNTFGQYSNVNQAAPVAWSLGWAPAATTAGSPAPTTSGTYVITYTTSNLVGIGTTAPAATLEVNGTTQFDSTITVSAALGFYSRTGAQLAALAPGAAGQVMYNSSRQTLCVSTGTGAGAWLFLSTSTTPGAICN